MYERNTTTTRSENQPHFTDRRSFMYTLGLGTFAAAVAGMMAPAGRELLSSITHGDQTQHIALSYEGGRKIMAFGGQTYEIAPSRFVESVPHYEIDRKVRVASSVEGLVRHVNPGISDAEAILLRKIAEQLYDNPKFKDLRNEGDKAVIRFDPHAKTKIMPKLAIVPVPRKLEQLIQ